MKSKYIIIDSMGIQLPIVFNPFIEHERVGNGLNIVAAGFCKRKGDEYECFGKSVSLGLSSRPQDAEIINKALQYDIF